jgi:hypothetical protein
VTTTLLYCITLHLPNSDNFLAIKMYQTMVAIPPTIANSMFAEVSPAAKEELNSNTSKAPNPRMPA